MCVGEWEGKTESKKGVRGREKEGVGGESEGEREREREREGKEALMSEDIHGGCCICLATIQGHTHTPQYKDTHTIQGHTHPPSLVLSQAHTHTHTHTHSYGHHTHTLSITHWCAHTQTHTHTQKGICVDDSSHAHSSISAAFPPVMVNNYTHTHTYITHTHTHIHKPTQLN